MRPPVALAAADGARWCALAFVRAGACLRPLAQLSHNQEPQKAGGERRLKPRVVRQLERQSASSRRPSRAGLGHRAANEELLATERLATIARCAHVTPRNPKSAVVQRSERRLLEADLAEASEERASAPSHPRRVER